MARRVNKEKREGKIRHILATAKQVFAEKGYEGARTDEIADRAGISKMSMYYYVGDKETLYEAVINDVIVSAEKHLLTAASSSDSPEDSIKQVVRSLAKIPDKEPLLHAIMLRELLSGGQHLPDEYPKAIRRNVKIIKDIIGKGKDLGVFNDTDPLIVFFLLMSFFDYWKTHLPFLTKIDLQHSFSKRNDKNISEKITEEIENIIITILTGHR